MPNDVAAIAVMSKEQIQSLKEHCDRIARSGLVPDHFAKNPAAIYTAINMAKALGEVPETLMQEIFFIGGRAGLSAKYMLSRLQRTRAIRGTVRYVVTGRGTSDLAVYAVAIDAETGETIEGPEVSMAMAVAEGWSKNPKYKSMPEVMLRKRAITFLTRDHYPGALMGFLTIEEAEDVAYAGGRLHATQHAAGAIGSGSDTVDVLNDTPPVDALKASIADADAEFKADAAKIDAGGDL